MQSSATTVKDYLATLPADRRAAIAAVRKTILANLDKGYQECMQCGMIGYSVPHSVFPPGYHCDPRQPLPFAGLASQKNHMAVYLMCIYGEAGEEAWLRSAWAKTGKKLDMGKSCIRFKRAEDLALDVIGEAIRRVPAKKYIEHYEASMAMMGKPVGKAAGKGPAPARKAAGKAVKKTAKKAGVKAGGKTRKAVRR